MTQRVQPTRPDVISLAEEERVNDVVLGAVLGLWDVVNYLTRLRPSRQEVFRHRTFFTRLHQFAIGSNAFIVAPGGIGTLLELVMIWQLLQVRHLQETPLILVGPMWPALIEWARQAMLPFDPPLANAEDLTIPRCVASADEALAIIQEHHAAWLSAQAPTSP